MQKSFFDVLMKKNKTNKDENKTSNDPKLNKSLEPQAKDDSLEIILIENTNLKNTQATNNEANKSSVKFKKRTSSKKLEKSVDPPPFLFDHIHQYSDEDNIFLNKQSDFIKLRTTDELDLATIELNKPLVFDFSKTFSKQFAKKCECKSEWDELNQDITFSLNNSVENLSEMVRSDSLVAKFDMKLGSAMAAEEKIEHIKDEEKLELESRKSFDTTTSSISSPPIISENRYSKRRKTDATKSKKVIKTKLSTNEKVEAEDEEENNNSQINESKKEKEIEAKNKSTLNDTKTEDAACQLDQDLWTEKYQFKNEKDIVTNKSQLERLKEWLNNWKIILSRDTMTNGKSKTNSYDSDSDYAYDSDNSNASSTYNGRKFYSNAILLSGPHGCGKTSSIYSVAKQLNFKVFEVNSSSLRCKSQIIQELEGALNSHHVSNNATSNSSPTIQPVVLSLPPINSNSKAETAKFKMEKFFNLTPQTSSQPSTSLFSLPVKPNIDTKTNESNSANRKKRKISLRKEIVLTAHNSSSGKASKKKEPINLTPPEGSNQQHQQPLQSLILNNEACNSATTINIHKESLILFDEIDVVFREDVGFWQAINHFIKRSKKPIILTTNDDFLQDKINLNIEKIEFIRPRIDASIRFLKAVAAKENIILDTPIAFKIIRESKCDMRRALVQLQALIQNSSNVKIPKAESLLLLKSYLNNLNSTVELTNKHLAKALFSRCYYHNESSYFSNISFLDHLTKKYKQSLESSNFDQQEAPTSFKKYDLFILRDGLTDNTATNSSIPSSATTAYTFNPFIPAKTKLSMESESIKTNTISVKDQLNNFYESFITLFNDNKFIEFNDWCKHGAINQFNFPSNVSINKFAQATYKNMSNVSISLDYRPFLQQICFHEELKHRESTKRRFVHYLGHLNYGLLKDDYSLLAKSSLVEELNLSNEASNDQKKANGNINFLLDTQIFCDDTN